MNIVGHAITNSNQAGNQGGVRSSSSSSSSKSSNVSGGGNGNEAEVGTPGINDKKTLPDSSANTSTRASGISGENLMQIGGSTSSSSANPIRPTDNAQQKSPKKSTQSIPMNIVTDFPENNDFPDDNGNPNPLTATSAISGGTTIQSQNTNSNPPPTTTSAAAAGNPSFINPNTNPSPAASATTNNSMLSGPAGNILSSMTSSIPNITSNITSSIPNILPSASGILPTSLSLSGKDKEKQEDDDFNFNPNAPFDQKQADAVLERQNYE